MKKLIALIMLLAVPANSEMLAEYGSFAKPNATTGHQSVAVGFLPKVVILFGNYNTTDGSNVGAREFMGAAVSSSKQFVIASASGDTLDPTRQDKRWSNALVITQITEPTPTVNAEAVFVGMDSSSFTINWTTCDASQRIINYLILGGDDLTNADVGSFTAPTSAGNLAVTGVGFQPDALIIVDNTATTTPTGAGNAASSAFNIGFVVGTAKQCSRSTFRQDNQATSNTWGYQRTDSCQNTVSGAGAVVRTATIGSMGTDGFTLAFNPAPANAVYINYIALKGGSYDTGAFDQAATTGNQSVATGFQPTGVILQSAGYATSASVSSISRISLGVGISSTQRGTIWTGDLDAQAAGVSDQVLDRTKCLTFYTEGTPTLDADMDFVSNDANGFTVNNTTADGTQREILYFAFGSGGAGPTPSTNNSIFFGGGL